MYCNGEDIQKRRLEIRDNIAKSLGIEDGYDEIEKARNVGDMHPNGKWVWTEYKPGKFDWRKSKGAGKKASESTKKNKVSKPKNDNSVNNYLSSPKFDLSEDQKKVASHLNEKLKSFMGMNESNVSLKDIQEAMGWNKNKTHDIVGALVSKEVLVEKIVPSMDGNDYKTYHFKDQENMTYKPTDKKDKN